MKDVKRVLKERYDIVAHSISEGPGGWASLGYKVEDREGRSYFMKVYEKRRRSTSYLTRDMDIYLPLVDWLSKETPLRGKMVRLVETLTGDLMCRDNGNIYILFDHIEGRTVGEQDLTEHQVVRLADIVSELHTLEVPSGMVPVTEKFDLPFAGKLYGWTGENFNILKEGIRDVLHPYISVIQDRIEDLKRSSAVMKGESQKFCLCHTDIHHWNIIVNGGDLYLIDWEGLKFAPAEADIYAIYRQPYFDKFMDKYCSRLPEFKMNEKTLEYYRLSRKLQDIYEFVEQLQFDDLGKQEYMINLQYLKKVTGVDRLSFDRSWCRSMY